MGRIVNGDKAVNYQFPWHVSLHVTKTTGTKSYCGGSIIAEQFVLTAASCLKDATSIQVDIGSIQFNAPYETQHSTQFQIHPNYNEDTKANNIAIIRLPSSLIYRTNIRAILLPRISDKNETFESYESYVCGFGVSEPYSSYLTNDLHYAHKTVITNEKCMKSFETKYIDSSVMCATGYDGSTQSICYGDQGGALVSHINGSWVQIGLASIVHPNGCTGQHPAGYSRITPHLEWIKYLTGIELRD